jgi:hypothetical protein
VAVAVQTLQMTAQFTMVVRVDREL